MYLTTRKVRSAGRSSGSIEITLPVQLHVLQDVACQVFLRDGLHPEVVLLPDLAPARRLFRDLWHKLLLGFDLDVAANELAFTLADFTLTLFPPDHGQGRPALSYADALTVLQYRDDAHTARDREALARLLALEAMVLGGKLGFRPALGSTFGEAIAYLMAGRSAHLGSAFERGVAHRLFQPEKAAWSTPRSPYDDESWVQARPGLQRVYKRFCSWQDHPDEHAHLQQQWFRAFSLETDLSTPA